MHPPFHKGLFVLAMLALLFASESHPLHTVSAQRTSSADPVLLAPHGAVQTDAPKPQLDSNLSVNSVPAAQPGYPFMASGKSTPLAQTFVFLPLVMNKFFSLFNDFNGSPGAWEAEAGAWAIGSGYYSTLGVSNGAASISYPADLANIDYEVKVRRFGCPDCASRLIIRGVPDPLGFKNLWYSSYIFEYTIDGRSTVWKGVSGGDYQPLQPWTPVSAINQGSGAWNTLRVVAYGSNLYYYINGVLVWSGADSSLTSGRVGIGTYRSASSTGDQFDIDYASMTVPYNTTSSTAPTPTDTSAAKHEAPPREDGQDDDSINIAPPLK